MDEQKDDVKIKNISEILSENLRILEQKNIPKNDDDILEKNSKKPLKELTYDRVQFSEDDLDVELLDLKDIHSKKALKKIRKLLHREIRDRVLQPFQKKQSEINKKLVQNFTEVYSELDFSSEQVDRNIRNIEFLLKESEKLNDSLDTKISDTQTDLDTKISDTQTDLDTKISDTQTDLDTKISDTQTDLDTKISDTKPSTQIPKPILIQRSQIPKPILIQRSQIPKPILIQRSQIPKPILIQRSQIPKPILIQRSQIPKHLR